MARLFLVLSLTGLLLGSVGPIRGDLITSQWNPSRGNHEDFRRIDEVSQPLEEATLAVTIPTGESLASVGGLVVPEGMAIPGSAAISLSLESITGHSTSQGDVALGVEDERSGLPELALVDVALEPSRNLTDELAIVLSNAQVRRISARLAHAKLSILALLGTGFVGIFFRTRILRERRTTLAIPQ